MILQAPPPVLVLAPIGRDAAEISRILGTMRVPARVFVSLEALCTALCHDACASAGALFVAEEAFIGGTEVLKACLARQPPWSDIPIVIFTADRQHRGSWRRWALFEELGNVTLLNRPLHAEALQSAARAALRARARQYETRQHLEALQRAAETLETRVEERTRELISTEERLRQSQKMEAVGQLTGGLAHDFNNLLTGISGSLEVIGQRLKQARYVDIDRYVGMAQREAQRAASLTHRLLAFSRRQTLDPKPTDVRRLIEGMEDLIRRTMGPAIEVRVIRADQLWNTLVDPHQLESALLNLCINARDAMPEGGRLIIETANVSLDERAAQEVAIAPGFYMAVSVTDTGIGMAPDIMARAFDPFFTTKPVGQGTGLGLSMIYGFAEQSGGKVTIHSQLGRGTTVRIYLPQHDGEAEELAEIDLEQTTRPKAKTTVLIVDDEPMVLLLVAETLTEAGYATIAADDGPSGLKVLQSNVPIDLLISDVGLPGGMNGRQMADAARHVRPQLKALFITGYAGSAVFSDGLEQHMHVLTKPFTMETLVRKVGTIVANDKATTTLD